MRSNRLSAARLGAVTGMKAAAVGALAYLLCFIGWYVVNELGTDPSIVLGALLVLVIGGLVGVIPAVLAALITGSLLGLVLRRSADRQRPALGLLAGIGLAGVMITLVNLIVLAIAPLQPSLYVWLAGLPSAIYVSGFGWIGVRLQRRLAEAGRPAPTG